MGEESGLWTAATLRPLASKRGMTFDQLDASAHAPWTRTMVGVGIGILLIVLCSRCFVRSVRPDVGRRFALDGIDASSYYALRCGAIRLITEGEAGTLVSFHFDTKSEAKRSPDRCPGFVVEFNPCRDRLRQVNSTELTGRTGSLLGLSVLCFLVSALGVVFGLHIGFSCAVLCLGSRVRIRIDYLLRSFF